MKKKSLSVVAIGLSLSVGVVVGFPSAHAAVSTASAPLAGALLTGTMRSPVTVETFLEARSRETSVSNVSTLDLLTLNPASSSNLMGLRVACRAGLK